MSSFWGPLHKRGTGGCQHSDYTHLLRFTQTGTNTDGAATGTLELLHKGEKDVVARDTQSFSGGTGYLGGRGKANEVPAPSGTYFVNLKSVLAQPSRHFNPQTGETYPTTGIEDLTNYTPAMKEAWGTLRARLNPSKENSGNELYRGIYLHGQLTMRKLPSATWGCICSPDQNVLKSLFNLSKQQPGGIVPAVVRTKK